MRKIAIIIFVFFSLNLFAQKNNKPNIVFILADDMGIGDVSGLNPNSKISTPNIDKLIASGMTFTDAHTASSVCTPSRYGIMTGRYAWRTKLKKGVLNGYSKPMIDDSTDTAPKLLQRNGYKTALIGKWHLGWNWALKEGEDCKYDNQNPYNYANDIENKIDFSKPFSGGPLDCGFDYFYGISASADFPPYVFCENNKVIDLPSGYFKGKYAENKKDLSGKQVMQRKGIKSKNFDAQNNLLTITEKSVSYIKKQNKKQPFFLFVSFTSPHTPVLPRKKFLGTSKAGIYGDFIQELDWSVGRIINVLQKKGLYDNTIIIFTADNGASRMSFPIEFEKKYNHKPSRELRGRKGTLHEGGHHVPFIVSWKNNIIPNSRTDATVCLNDFYATCADLVDEKIPENQGFDSFNFYNLLKGNNNYERKSTVYSNFGGKFSIRKGDWKLDFNPKPEKRKLFNLKKDRSEKNNLYGKAEYKNIEKELTEEIKKIIFDGRSTVGKRLINEGTENWEQMYWTDNTKDKKVKVFFLAGQSNMDGRARAYKLTEEDKKRLKNAQKNVTLYYNHQKPVPLQVTTPNDFVQKKFNTKQVFGPELFFGIKMSEKYPDSKIILIKRSRGGMSLYGAWNPNWTLQKAKAMREDDDPKLYDDFINYADSILNTFDKTEYELCGMLWVQGESDSGTKKNGTAPADSYEENLKNLISGVRKKFNKSNLPFIIFQVGHGKVVKAMKNIAKNDKYVSLIPQEKNKNSEFYFERNPSPIGHYKYEAMKKIGTYFFEYYKNNYSK